MTIRRGRSPMHDRSVYVQLALGAVFAGMVCGIPGFVWADWTQTFTFDPGDLRVSQVRGYDELALRECVVDAGPGAPRLPMRVFTFTVPDGEKVVGVEVVSLVSEAVPGRFNILPGGGEHAELPVRKDEDIWNLDGPYPSQVAELGGSGFMGGRRVASIILHPVRLNPAEGELLFSREVHVRIMTAASNEIGVRCERPGARRPALIDREFSAQARALEREASGKGAGGGAETSGTFQPTEFPSLDGSLVEYLIVTVDELASEFQRLADWKTSCGVPAVVKTVSWIEANYPGGVDLPEKIRLFIRDAYQNWGTVWVLLGGDEEQIPIRLAHSNYYSPGDWLITCDMYYQCLDGNWNADGDHLYGEGYEGGSAPGDSVDFYPEVFLGRLSVEDVSEAGTCIDNAMAYRKTPSSGYLKKALFLGEVVFPVGWDPGDPVYLDGAEICDQAAQWFPSDWDTVKLYEINGNENHDAILDEMNAGYGIVNVVNHGDAFKMSCSDDSYLYLSDMDSLQNSGKMGFIYTSNCNLSQVELDCYNEHLTQNPDRGYIGAIGSTRFCFPHAGRDFQEEVFRLMFDAGVTRQGEIHALHKLPFAPVSTNDGSAYRWTILSYILLGDPELPIWVDEPQTLDVVHSGSMSLGDSLYAVQVSSAALPVPGVTVCLWKQDTGEYARGLTDDAGQIDVSFEPGSTGDVSLVVIADGYLPYETTVSVGGSGRVQVGQVAVNDAVSGNGDGRWDAGETADLDVTLQNGTSTAVEGVTAELGLVSGATLTLDMTFDGQSAPELLHFGADAGSPGSLPAVFSVSDGALLGRPFYSGAPADTGVYFWLDHNGWHLRAAGGLDSHDVWTSVTTDGRFLDVEGARLEGADSLWSATQEFQLFAQLDPQDYEDGVDAVLADTVGVHIPVDAADFGTIGSGQGSTESFTVGAASGIADGVPVWFILDITSGGDTWSEWIRMDVHAPEMSEYYHGIDDSTYGGNANAKAEVGEIVILRSAILNRGSGTAGAVTAVLRGIAGVDISDSTASIGTVEPNEIVQASDGFVFACLSSSMVLSLELNDAEGRSWVETLELEPPLPPSGLEAASSSEWIDLIWDPAAEADLFGYTVYRRDGRDAYQRVSPMMDEGTAYHRDYGLVPGHAYEYVVTAVDTSGNESTFSDPLNVSTSPSQMTGFPVRSRNQIYSSPTIGDLDQNGDLETVVGSKDGFVYAWHHDGELVSGWPKDTGGEIWGAPCLANLDDDPELEVLVGTWNDKIMAWNHDGTGYLTPDGTFDDVPRWVRSSPTCHDVDYDGRLEVVVGCSNGYVYAWNHDGTGYLQPDGLFATPGGGEISGSPAILDIDGDRRCEIFLGSLNGNLYAWNHDGTGLIESSGIFGATGDGIWGSPAIGDIDDDGDYEIVVGSWSDSVYVWDDDGTLAANWPKSAQDDIWSSPALGDVDGDGDLEIFVGSNSHQVYAWHHDGTGVTETSGRLAVCGDDVWSSPCLVDIDGDGVLDVVAGSIDGKMYAWNSGGEPIPGWPVSTLGEVYASPAIADLDEDGDVEILCVSYDGMVYAYDLSASWNPAAADWPMFQHDMYNTGFHGFSGFLDVASEASDVVVLPGLEQNYPNPFNPETQIAYRVAVAAEVELAVYDVAGRRVTTLVSKRQAPGVYRVGWHGLNSQGEPVASGVYFCRLCVGREQFSKKMVLMK